MRVNGEDLLVFRYDVPSSSEAVLNAGGAVILNVTYDQLGRPLQWTPAHGFYPLAVPRDLKLYE